jgi:hypothetical protein
VMHSSMQKSVTLLVAKAEQAAAGQMAQDMLFVMRLLESLGLMKVQKPMILKLYNLGAHDLAHNWSIGGRTQQVEVHVHFSVNSKKRDSLFVIGFAAMTIHPTSSPRTYRDLCSTNMPVDMLVTTST